MSEFLLIVPEGWLEVDWVIAGANPDLSVTAVTEWCLTGQYGYLDTILKDMGLIPLESYLLEAKLLGETLVVRLG